MQPEVANAGHPGERRGVSAPCTNENAPSTRGAYATPLAGHEFFRRLAIIVWVVILVATCGRALAWPRSHSVYSIYAEAGRNWVASANLYNSTEHPYRYSPFATLLFVPFGLMSEAIGGCLWRLMNAAVLIGGLLLWMRDLLPISLSRAQHALLWLVIAPLAVGNLHNGQSNPLVLGLLL